MDRINIESFIDVADIMHDFSENEKQVTFIGLYEDVCALVRYLVTLDDVGIQRIDIEPIELDGYDREYYVDLDTNKRLWVEKAYNYENDIYIMNETDVLLIADDCNSKIIGRVDYARAYEIGYEDDEPECDCNCEHCHCDDNHEVVTRVAVDEEGVIRGFEKSWSTHEDGMYYHSTYAHYSNNPDMLKQMMDNFQIKY